MQAGISSITFWDMTLAEINAEIKAYNENSKKDMQWQAVLVYKQADLIAHNVRLLFQKGEAIALYEAFPSLFEKVESPKQQDWRIAKERLLNYANWHNNKNALSRN